MSLLKDFEAFFSEYDTRERDFESYVADLISLLHRLADDQFLSDKDRKQLSTVIAKLDSDLEEIKELSSDRDKAKELRDTRTKAKENVNDFRHGDVFKRFRQAYKDNQDLSQQQTLRTIQPLQSRDDRVQTAPEAKTQAVFQVDEGWRAAINIAKEIKPHGSVEEILIVAKELRTMAAQPGRIQPISRAPQGTTPLN